MKVYLGFESLYFRPKERYDMNPKELDGVHHYSLANSIRSKPKVWTWVYKPNKYGCGCAVVLSYCDDLLRAEWRYARLCREHYNIDAATSEGYYSYGPNYDPYAEWYFPSQKE